MFFYTFNPETLEIVDKTHAFIPKTSNTNVIFPAGLVYSKNVIVSYGDGDNSMKLLQITPEYLNILLAENPSPAEYRFKVL
jgi:hypothetical protein